MRTIIVGCGRVGAGLAEQLARANHDVTIIDVSTEAFARLESDFPGTAIRGDGTDEDVLRRAGAEGADCFFALTEGDNRNILAAQLANESLGIQKVVAKINDPVRAEAYTSLGIATVCRTTLLVDALARDLGLPGDPGAQGVSPSTGHHPTGNGRHARVEVRGGVGATTSVDSDGAGPDATRQRQGS
jgi:trk system potassium uptake protein TrkA